MHLEPADIGLLNQQSNCVVGIQDTKQSTAVIIFV